MQRSARGGADGEWRPCSCRGGARWTSRNRGHLTDLETMLPALSCGAQHDFGVALVGHELVREPVAVVRERRRTDAFPSLDVGGGERAGGAGRRWGGCRLGGYRVRDEEGDQPGNDAAGEWCE